VRGRNAGQTRTVQGGRLQSGVGNIANAVLFALAQNKAIPNFEMYTEVVQDSVVPFLESGAVPSRPPAR